MRFRKIAAVFTLFMLGFLIVFVLMFRKASYPQRDIVYYNDLLARIEEDISAGRDISDIEKEYGCTIVYSKRIDAPELSPLYRDEAFVLDLSVGGEYVGKVAWMDREEKYEAFGRSFFVASMIFWSLTLIMGLVLLYLVYDSFVKPSRDLKAFSEELAKGNLDTALPIKKNDFFGSFTEAFDIMREELKNSRDKEMRAEIARKEMVASLSHDVKTPVAVIDATCEVSEVKLLRRLKRLREMENPSPVDIEEVEDSIDKVRTISAKAGTINSLMADLLHSSLEDSERVVVKTEEEFATLIEDYFIKIRDYGKIVIENHIPKCLLYMDRQRMEQVIDNIIGNSVKYAGTEIKVRFDDVNDMLLSNGKLGNFVRITIKDSGPGVSEDDLPLIAQKYYRGSNSAEKSGYGMGLYLVKQYMQKQGGDMEYYNDNGFTVVLMLKKV
ncbi:MAG: HAMP domain-containing histidine kinase [Lachnospiraceae bacterium]|nr:HAMP domain-containing histidine kinase [Lachnospiraceae bacterium]